MFSDFDMHPQDMNFKVYAAGEKDSFSNEFFNERLQITTSHAIESSVPGKSLKWIVQETNSKRLLDSVDLDPLQSILNLVMSGWDMSELTRFNRHAIMGFILLSHSTFWFQLPWG